MSVPQDLGISLVDNRGNCRDRKGNSRVRAWLDFCSWNAPMAISLMTFFLALSGLAGGVSGLLLLLSAAIR